MNRKNTMRFCFSRFFIATMLLLWVVLAVATTTRAQGPNNGGFETGDFASWFTSGNATVRAAGSFDLAPIRGSFSALISTIGPPVTNAASLAAFANITETQLNAVRPVGAFSAEEGAAIQQTFAVAANDTLSLQYFFLSNEGPIATDFNDYAFVAFTSATQPTVVERLAATSPDTAFFGGATFDRRTNLRTYTRTFTTAATVTLTLGTVDVGATGRDSALFVDNVSVVPANVPEPSTLILALVASGFFGIVRRKVARPHRQP